MTRKAHGLTVVLLMVLCLCLVPLGACGKKKSGDGGHEDAPKASKKMDSWTDGLEVDRAPAKQFSNKSASDCAAAGVNESNYVPILMYHGILDMTNAEAAEAGYVGGNAEPTGVDRTAEAFRSDLEYYYENGYQFIRLTDFVDGYIDCEFGKSPIVLTFDDGLDEFEITGWKKNGDPIFKENSALAIMEEFKKEHPDANLTATFFLIGYLFNLEGEGENAKALQWMVDNGYDIANHTYKHYWIPNLNADEIQEAVGKQYEQFESIIPGKWVNIVALVAGEPADVQSEDRYLKLIDGVWNGKSYHTKAIMLASWMATESPFVTAYDTTYIKRIKGYDNNGEDWDIAYNFKLLDEGMRYISDGNPYTITIPEDEAYCVTKTYDLELITY